MDCCRGGGDAAILLCNYVGNGSDDLDGFDFGLVRMLVIRTATAILVVIGVIVAVVNCILVPIAVVC